MSWHLTTGDLVWIDINYTKKESAEEKHNFQVKCNRCGEHVKYAKIDKFQKHMREKHKYERKYEKRKSSDVWKYYNLTTEGKKRCIVCNSQWEGKRSNDFFRRHLQTHKNENLEPYKSQGWAWKYIEAEKVTNFYGKCTLCDRKMRLPFTYHLLKQHLTSEHEKFIDSSERNEQVFKSRSTSPELWWFEVFYTKAEEDFRATCMICKQNYSYVEITSFKNHIRKHKDIYVYENYMKTTEERKIGWKCMRFIEDNAREIECMICHEILSNKSFINSHKKHDLVQLYPYQIHWTYKYMKQLGNLTKCTICEKKVKVVWHESSLKDHIVTQHRKKYNKMHRLRLREYSSDD
nr:PREDICTED: uncharacterized protein LOC105673219 [Linepithema humile]